MIIVHDIFICKPGNASKLAKLFKEVMAGNDELRLMWNYNGTARTSVGAHFRAYTGDVPTGQHFREANTAYNIVPGQVYDVHMWLAPGASGGAGVDIDGASFFKDTAHPYTGGWWRSSRRGRSARSAGRFADRRS